VDLGEELTVSRVAIIGAGYAGLAAAVELADAGVTVTVFEASRTLGGRARRLEINGLSVDNGQHLLIGAYRETLRLIGKVGGTPERCLRRQPFRLDFSDGFTLRAARLPAPLHLGLALLKAPLSWSERHAAAGFIYRLKRNAFCIGADRTVAVLLDEFAQPPAVRRRLWEPLCLAALNTPPERASARVFAKVLHDSLGGSRAASDLLQPAVDLGRLFPEPAARFVAARGGRVATACPVRGICADGEGFRLDADAFTGPYRHVIVAVAAYHLPPLLAAHPVLDATIRQAASLRHEPIATAYLAYAAHVRLPRPMIGMTSGHAQWLFDRGRLAGQDGLVAAVISAGGPWQGLTREELLADIHQAVSSVADGLPPPLWTRLIVEQRATFACAPNLERPPLRTPLPGLWLAGDYVASDYPATLEGAVRSGVAAARSVIDELSGGQP